jgi:chromosome segregation ATPase
VEDIIQTSIKDFLPCSTTCESTQNLIKLVHLKDKDCKLVAEIGVTLIQKYEQLQKDYNKIAEEKAEVYSVLIQCKESLLKFTELSNQTQSEKLALENKLQDYKHTIEIMEDENHMLKTQIEGLTLNLKSVSRASIHNIKELESALSVNESVEDIKSTSEQLGKKFQSELRSLRSKIKELQEENKHLEGLESAMSISRTEKSKLQSEIQSLHEKIYEKDREIESLIFKCKDVDHLSQLVKELNHQNKGLKNVYSETLNLLEEARNELSIYRNSENGLTLEQELKAKSVENEFGKLSERETQTESVNTDVKKEPPAERMVIDIRSDNVVYMNRLV